MTWVEKASALQITVKGLTTAALQYQLTESSVTRQLTCWDYVTRSCDSVATKPADPLTSFRDRCSDCGTIACHRQSSYSCNSPVYNAPRTSTSTTCLVTGTQCCKHFTPVLQKLHWLPICQMVEFKLACEVHQSLAGHTLRYLTSDIQLTADTGRPHLRSVSERICVIPCTHNSFGDKSFSAVGPRV